MPLSTLPPTFTRKQAEAAGLSKHALYRLRDRGELEVIARGVYRRHDAELADEDLLEVATRNPRATLCLTSALVRHGLSDAIPSAHDVALPRGTRPPVVRVPMQWHFFDAASFDVGRETFAIDAHTRMGLYSAPRSIADAFRLRGREGYEVATEALKRWLRLRGAEPAELLTIGRATARCPRPTARARGAAVSERPSRESTAGRTYLALRKKARDEGARPTSCCSSRHWKRSSCALPPRRVQRTLF